MGILIGLDVGTKTLGVARAPVGFTMAFPAFTLARAGVRRDVAALKERLREYTIDGVVVGLPYELEGAEGRSARLARQIGEEIRQAWGVPVYYQDERFSTVEATSRLHAKGLKVAAQRSIIDQAAAAVILQDWLESRAAQETHR
jgi:putative Holliday junction resolvase